MTKRNNQRGTIAAFVFAVAFVIWLMKRKRSRARNRSALEETLEFAAVAGDEIQRKRDENNNRDHDVIDSV